MDSRVSALAMMLKQSTTTPYLALTKVAGRRCIGTTASFLHSSCLCRRRLLCKLWAQARLFFTMEDTRQNPCCVLTWTPVPSGNTHMAAQNVAGVMCHTPAEAVGRRFDCLLRNDQRSRSRPRYPNGHDLLDPAPAGGKPPKYQASSISGACPFVQ